MTAISARNGLPRFSDKTGMEPSQGIPAAGGRRLSCARFDLSISNFDFSTAYLTSTLPSDPAAIQLRLASSDVPKASVGSYFSPVFGANMQLCMPRIMAPY